MADYRHSDDNQIATRAAPPRERRRVESLRSRATERKLLLLECAICRHAPFSQDGQTIWQLLPGFSWFRSSRVSALHEEPPRIVSITAHDALVTVEQMADGDCSPDDANDAREYLRHTEWLAEADRFGYDPERADGSLLRYGVAYWIWLLADAGTASANILDYYLTAFNREYYAWAHNEPLHPGHRSVALELIRDIFGDPFRPAAFDPAWRTGTAVSLAQHIYNSRDFGAMPILADALQDAGCDNDEILNHCRDEQGPHVRGCWVVDLVLGKS